MQPEKDSIMERIRNWEEEAVEIRRQIHRHPELSMKEEITTGLIRRTLEKYGIPEADILLPSGVAAVLEGTAADPEGKKKTLLLRADIDALPMEEKSGLSFASEHPGICHSCGHDIHTSALLLCARILSDLRHEFSGKVLFLFQPGEETGQGARAVMDSGLLERYKPDLAVGAHCWPELPGGAVGFRKGSFMASSDLITLTVKGKGGHGAHPHKSIDPVTIAAYLLTELQTIISRSVAPLDSAVLTMGKITGGTAANIIPDEVVMEGTIRTVSNETRAMVKEKIRIAAENGARALGAECRVENTEGMPALVCDSQAVDLLVKAAEEELGKEQVLFLETPSMGSEDFARYLEQIPGAMFRLGTCDGSEASRLPLHNASVIFDERAISSGAAVMSRLALNFLK